MTEKDHLDELLNNVREKVEDTVIPIKRVVVDKDGETYDSPGAMARHEHQKSIGKERTTVQIRRVTPYNPR